MGEGLRKQFGALADRFDAVIDEVKTLQDANEQKDSHVSAPEALSILIFELKQILKEAKAMAKRKRMLLQKPRLSTEEKTEIKILTEIGVDVSSLILFVKDFSDDFSIERKTIYDVDSFSLLVRFRDLSELTNKQILSKLPNSDLAAMSNSYGYEKRWEAMRDLSLTDKDFDVNNAYMLLKYGALSESQKDKLLSMSMDSLCKSSEVLVAALFLAEFDLALKYQNRLVAALTKEAKRFVKELNSSKPTVFRNYSGLAAYIFRGFHEADILSNAKLSPENRSRIATMLVQTGSAFDCKYLLNFYRDYLSPSDVKTAEERLKNSHAGDVELPYLYDSFDKLTSKKVEFIVHPLYNLFYGEAVGAGYFDKDIKDPVEAFEKGLLRDLKQTVVALMNNEKGAISDYIRVLNSVDEYERYKEMSEDKSKFFVFFLPKLYKGETLLHDKGKVVTDTFKDRIFYALMKRFSLGGNMAFIETDTAISGYLKKGDMKLLDKLLPQSIEIVVSGGFVGQCLGNALDSLVQLGGKRRFTLDYSDSVSNTSTLRRGSTETSFFSLRPSELKKYNFPELKFDDASLAIQTYADILAFVKNNKDFNIRYRESIYALDSYASRRDSGSADSKIRHRP